MHRCNFVAFLSVLALSTACGGVESSGTSSIGPADTLIEDSSPSQRSGDAVAIDTVESTEPDTQQPLGGDVEEPISEDVSPPEDSADAELPPAPRPDCPGEFGCPCEQAEDCYSGYCLPGPSGELECSKTCEGECPPGYLCAQAPGASDVTFVCVAEDDPICVSCTADEECGNMGGQCLLLSDGSQRCGRGCTLDTDCPEGFTCSDTGGEGAQCTPLEASCPCIAETVGITQLCTSDGDLGSCEGEERCESTGWSACDAPDAAAEVCDGDDQDCDGAIDEGLPELGAPCDGDGVGCELGTIVCQPADGGLLCIGDYTPEETCNGEDDDCDDLIDEDFGDLDGDGVADCVDDDDDDDGTSDEFDTCPELPDPDQTDLDGDGLGDACDSDADGDGTEDTQDLCPGIADPAQTDTDADGLGDACDDDDDNDADPDTTDCMPLNAAIFTGAEELCDGVDQDCDDTTDEGFPDGDNDGLPDCLDDDADADGVLDEADNCTGLANPSQTNTDGDAFGDACDDDDDDDGDPDETDCQPANALFFTGAQELCDGLDQDCDTAIDEGFNDLNADGEADCLDVDDDGDGVIDEADTCPQVANSDQTDTDSDGDGDACDDDDDGDGDPDSSDCGSLDASIFTGATEVCDGVDQDCDDAVDEGFSDADSDGSADCVDPDDDGDDVDDAEDNCLGLANADQVDTDSDDLGDPCDDDDDGDGASDDVDCAPLDPLISQSAAELCDGVDQDCDGATDEGFSDSDADLVADCIDEDDDGDGDVDIEDCEPLDPDIFQGAVELCDGVDQDCDDATDEGFEDTDSDGDADCVDIDDDADGVLDTTDNCPTLSNTGQSNFDGDQLGDACDPDDDNDTDPDAVDCAPFNPGVYHGAQEACNGVDDNCNGDTDESFPDLDADQLADCVDPDDDGDGALDESDNCPGLPNPQQLDTDADNLGNLCDGDDDGDATPDELDCAPLDPSIHLTAAELCDGINQDCDALIDEGFANTDGDSQADCVDPDDDGDGDPDVTDCAPLDDAVFNGATELCDGVDQNCNGLLDEYSQCSGCADGSREGFTNSAAHPEVAACSGGWSVPGLLSTMTPTCDRNAGDDSSNPNGAGCSVADLCAPGWHVCASAGDFAQHSPTGCNGLAAAPGLFFASRQSGPGSKDCGAGANDLFGCGTLGEAPNGSCSPFTAFSQDLCSVLGSPWSCGANGYQEANNVTKSSSAKGGVLCCLD
ncbi:MAG: thrombospondin type 3 repeat-containing protein [Myxococcota bacterium]